jgi:hypothetical protein
MMTPTLNNNAKKRTPRTPKQALLAGQQFSLQIFQQSTDKGY